MVGPTQMAPHQPQPQSQTLPTPEEEALKRNTDCVYFLASPLTCKKGAECDYRHSEIARMNPRDCWYWLNGSCLNPKCAFRHPPLEGMLAPQVPAVPSGPTPPSSQTITPLSSILHNLGKQGIPCIFFQKGFCLKGDRCPFSHGPVLANNIQKAPQGPAPSAAFPEPSALKKPFAGLEKCSTEPMVVVESYIPPMPTKMPLQAKRPIETSSAKNEATIERHVRNSSDLVDDYAPKYASFTNEDLISRTNCIQQVETPDDYDTLNGDDAEEISREPSPGFDVLVDDEQRDGNYYQDEDHFERTRGNEDRRLTPVKDYDICVNYKDYDSFADSDRDTYRGDPHMYDRTRGQYGRDQRRVSSERTFAGSERRYHPSSGDSPDRIDGSDLRNRLSKHRRVNGLKSVISRDLDRDGWEQSYMASSRRVMHHLPASERGVSDRLRGRIKLPGRSISPLDQSNLHQDRERERERGNFRGRLSPGRLQGFGHQGSRVQDRIKGRVHEDAEDRGRDFRGPRMREMLYDNNVNFAGPKSLSELRGRKGNEYITQQPLNDYIGKRKYSESYQQAENDVSFEGPKPLREILKRKRGSDDNEEGLKGGSKASKEIGEDSIATEGRTLERNASDLQMEEGLIVDDDEVEDQEHEEGYAEGEGEYKYEHVEGEEYYKEDDAENAEEEREYTEDDEGDDFAKRIGVMFS